MTSLKTAGPSKAHLRRETLARRDRLPAEARIEASLAVAAHGREGLEIRPGEVVSGFWPIRSEVDIRPLMADLADLGARLCLPVILDSQTILFREMERGAPMIDTGFGTIGPGEGAAELKPTLMLVPLAAFDARGHRIGYGAGYYDRAVAKLASEGPRPRLVGVCFDLQEVGIVPDEDHDELLDAVLTESGLRFFGTGL
jgi:5-formyltetrahydrofolate cyclo-ligase